MRKWLSLIIIAMVFVSCMTTRTIKKETTTEVRRIEVKSDSAFVIDTLDLWDLAKDWDDDKVIDSEELTVKIPKKVILPVKKEKVKIDDRTTVDLEISTVLDSGRIIHEVSVLKVAYQESTVYEHVEIETSPNYIKWFFYILGGMVIIVLIVLIRK